MKKVLIGILVCACYLPTCDAVAQQKKATQPSKAKSIPTEYQLRLRLQYSPHNSEAHKALINLLRDKYAFRAMVVEDASWLANNREDSFTLIELTSYAESALHDPEYAIEQLRLQLAAVPRNGAPTDYDDWSDQLAAKLRERGRPEEALPLIREVVRLNPTEAGFWADYGDVLSVLGQKEEAARAFRRSIELNPSMESVHEYFAGALLRAGDLSSAESEFRASLSVYEAQYKKGEPTDSFHSFVNSMVKIEAASKGEHALAATRMKLSHVLLLEKKYDDAMEQAKGALEADKNCLSSYYLQAEILDAKGNNADASKMRDEAAQTVQKEVAKERSLGKNEPHLDPRVLFLSDSIWDEGQPAFPAEIISILEPRSDSLSSYERIMLATAYFSLDKNAQGKEQWEKAIADDAKLDNPVNHANLGEALLKAAANDDALKHFRKAYELDPQNVTFRREYETLRERTK